MKRDELPAWLVDSARKPLVMGILNVTPDSFSDGGRYSEPDAAITAARTMAAAGADWIDIGGESTRPGSNRVDASEQIRRISPVLEALRSDPVDAIISIDTTLAPVAACALDLGADVINDISAGRDDSGMLPLAARRGAPIVLMHMQGNPQTMQTAPTYARVISEVGAFLLERLHAAEQAGIERSRVLFDPGIGFGKALEHNLELLRGIGRLASLGQPLVIGTSRKSFLSKITGETDPARPFSTAASVAWAVANGAAIVRVHDAAGMAHVVDTTWALMKPSGPPI